ncbi:MAG: hypothetical protein HYX47_17865 [Burkholderiales bacterium]|nr:hypothetical protein [Burkholderiales bacterium]
MKKFFKPGGAMACACLRSLCAASVLLAGAGMAAAQVRPPPLPPGSAQVKVEAGLDRNEAKRQERAHHHKFHNRKDYTRDDTIFGDPSEEEERDKGKDNGKGNDKGSRK